MAEQAEQDANLSVCYSVYWSKFISEQTLKLVAHFIIPVRTQPPCSGMPGDGTEYSEVKR